MILTKKVSIPNEEVAGVFSTAVRTAHWGIVGKALERSEQLLQAVWNQDEEKVAAGMEDAHLETSILAYNDENSLSCTIALALFSAREYYFMIRELPSGKGFSDIVYLPRKQYPDKPALIVELKWNKDAGERLRRFMRVGIRILLRAVGRGLWQSGRLCGLWAGDCGKADDSAGCGPGMRRETHLGRTGATLR